MMLLAGTAGHAGEPKDGWDHRQRHSALATRPRSM
ncbi:hypothetical protein EV193_104487 [Herbihabitans rhizosphaerae]|uniref:Uncharacterized protein n=1 Tax=Herbihabitans rhizosphaerae TaxID=1872711 RepID=A0A4Q7KT04_9PSEU|nr:hypothetical protein EV193_104487 [Herbihabitans rhizosphaerae]